MNSVSTLLNDYSALFGSATDVKSFTPEIINGYNVSRVWDACVEFCESREIVCMLEPCSKPEGERCSFKFPDDYDFRKKMYNAPYYCYFCMVKCWDFGSKISEFVRTETAEKLVCINFLNIDPSVFDQVCEIINAENFLSKCDSLFNIVSISNMLKWKLYMHKMIAREDRGNVPTFEPNRSLRLVNYIGGKNIPRTYNSVIYGIDSLSTSSFSSLLVMMPSKVFPVKDFMRTSTTQFVIPYKCLNAYITFEPCRSGFKFSCKNKWFAFDLLTHYTDSPTARVSRMGPSMTLIMPLTSKNVASYSLLFHNILLYQSEYHQIRYGEREPSFKFMSRINVDLFNELSRTHREKIHENYRSHIFCARVRAKPHLRTVIKSLTHLFK